MRYSSVEILMGAVVLITAIFFLILGMQSIDNNKKDGYHISLIFGSSAGLKNGDDVKISGINVGKITKLDLDLADYNILVNTVSPGFVDTELTRKILSSKEIKKLASEVPLKKLAKPKDISDLILFLASSHNTYLTGQNIIIDGGFSIS